METTQLVLSQLKKLFNLLLENWIRSPCAKIISKRCELVKLCHINRSSAPKPYPLGYRPLIFHPFTVSRSAWPTGAATDRQPASSAAESSASLRVCCAHYCCGMLFDPDSGWRTCVQTERPDGARAWTGPWMLWYCEVGTWQQGGIIYTSLLIIIWQKELNKNYSRNQHKKKKKITTMEQVTQIYI